MSADGHHTSKEIVVGGISSLDEPSVQWGWHQHNRKVGLVRDRGRPGPTSR